MNDSSQGSPQVRGISAFNARVRFTQRLIAWAGDLAFMLLLSALTLKIPALNDSVNFSFLFQWVIPVTILMLFVFFRISLKSSPGKFLWKLKHTQEGLRQTQKLSFNQNLQAGLVLGLLFLISGYSIYDDFRSHPLLMNATSVQFNGFAPPANESNWKIRPFYFSMGAWPETFDSKPIFHSLPYEKGPPVQFVGHMTARWRMPDIQVTFVGPLTPQLDQPQDFISQCFLDGFQFSFIDCLKIREKYLKIALSEMKSFHPITWEMKWFRVENPALPNEDQPKGILIRAKNSTHAQERFIVINSKNTYQSFVLDYPLNSDGERAKNIFEKAIQSLRVSHELYTAKAWADHELGQIKMSDSDTLLEIARIQSALLSKISVDPKGYDAYFHLGGTSSILVKKAIQDRNAEYAAVAQGLARSALKYAIDIAPDDPRTIQLQNIWSALKVDPSHQK